MVVEPVPVPEGPEPVQPPEDPQPEDPEEPEEPDEEVEDGGPEEDPDSPDEGGGDRDEGPRGDDLDVGLLVGQPHPPVPGDVILSVLSDRTRADSDSETAGADPVPTTHSSFLKELKSFWTAEADATQIIELGAVKSDGFWNDVQQMLDDFDDDAKTEKNKDKLSAEAAAGISLSLTAGFVSWALRAGSMAASFLAAMPTWRNFDPMPVLAADDKKKQHTIAEDEEQSTTAGDDDRVDEMFDR